MGELGNAVRHATLGIYANLNQTGLDGIDPNAFGGQFVCQAWGKSLNRSFTGCIVYLFMRHALVGSRRTDIDHPTSVMGAHIGHRLARNLDRCRNIEKNMH